MSHKSPAIFLFVLMLSGCAIDTSKKDYAKLALTESSLPGTYSLYGKSMQRDEETGLAYIDVYVGGGGDLGGSQRFAANEIQRYSQTNGFTSYEIVKSEYSFFPLSKYRLFVQYNK